MKLEGGQLTMVLSYSFFRVTSVSAFDFQPACFAPPELLSTPNMDLTISFRKENNSCGLDRNQVTRLREGLHVGSTALECQHNRSRHPPPP